jgi:UDP-N-acetylmuramyl pentapeptide synthase
MAHLWEKTPEERRGASAKTSAELKDSLLEGLHAGDVVMIKGSLGSRMGPLVDAIKERFAPLNRDL